MVLGAQSRKRIRMGRIRGISRPEGTFGRNKERNHRKRRGEEARAKTRRWFRALCNGRPARRSSMMASRECRVLRADLCVEISKTVIQSVGLTKVSPRRRHHNRCSHRVRWLCTALRSLPSDSRGPSKDNTAASKLRPSNGGSSVSSPLRTFWTMVRS